LGQIQIQSRTYGQYQGLPIVDVAAEWKELLEALGLQQINEPSLLATAIKAVLVGGIALWLGGWIQRRIRRVARQRGAYTDVVSLLSRAAAMVVYALGAAIVLGIAGVNLNAFATIFAAATIGSSLAVQDVARGFVNGLYLFIERPYRVGDRIRIGDTTGRVEDIGIRLTRLRSDAGERTLVPNSLIFTSAVEQLSTGQIDRRHYRVSGITTPILEIERDMLAALKGTSHLTARSPAIDIVSAGPEGATVLIGVEHDLGHRIDAQILYKVQVAFPGSVVAVQPAEADA
jgi:small-conductance mechanosensitive channel